MGSLISPLWTMGQAAWVLEGCFLHIFLHPLWAKVSFYCCTQFWGSKICSSFLGPCDQIPPDGARASI